VTESITLADFLRTLADEYDRQWRPWVSSRRRRDLSREADFLRRVVGNRDATDPNRLRIHGAQLMDITIRWCHNHGYRCVGGTNGLTIQRGDEPVVVAALDTTLLWDGERIGVQP
jgi:hypothetical protein